MGEAASTKDPRRGQRTFVCVLAAVFMAFTYLSMGYAVCAGVPFVTERLAYATIDDSGTPFDKGQLVEGALATRDYSFGSHDLGAFEGAIRHMNERAGTPYAEAEDILDVPERYTVGHEALSHLDDVNDVSGRVMMPIIGMAAMAAFLLFAGFRMFGARVVARMLLLAGGISGALLLVLALWAVVSFDGLFAALHSLLFADGTWTFPADSLLISMLPQGFWAGMGATWLAVSLAMSAASVALGFALRRRTCK